MIVCRRGEADALELGRAIGRFLMLSGVALFRLLTANIAAFFVERTQEETTRDPVVAKLDEVLERLAVLEERLERQR